MVYQCTKEKSVISININLQLLVPEGVCCCLQTCNRRFVMRAIWYTSVPSFIGRKECYKH